MEIENQDEIITLLEELVRWTRFQGVRQAKEVLKELLEGNTQLLIYHLSDGRSSEEIGKVSGVSSQTVRNYWRSWYTSGIASPYKKYKGRFEKVFNLEDLGIPIPKQSGVPAKQEENGSITK
jgi:hypothetical protein